ncbi:MAG: hypothetical protein Q9176_005876 [Flavoplaca citrina]
MKYPIITGSLQSDLQKLEMGHDLATTSKPAASTSKTFIVEAGPGSAQSGVVTESKSETDNSHIEPSVQGISNIEAEKESTTLVSSTNATPETEYVYLVYHSRWGEKPKRIDRAYRTSDEAIEYCRNETLSRGPFWVHADKLLIGDGLWALRGFSRDSYVVEQKPLNKEAPVGLKMGGKQRKSRPGNIYVVISLQSGIVAQKSVFWTENMSVLAVCKNHLRAHEVRFVYCEELEELNKDDDFIKKGETFAIDVSTCVLY